MRQAIRTSAGFGLGIIVVLLLVIVLRSFFALNVSPSLPEWGWFRWPFISADANGYSLGDRVEFRLTYFDTGPIGSVKIIAGLPGEVITSDASQHIYVNGRLIGRVMTLSGTGEPFEAIATGIIPSDHFFMSGEHPSSFDSRYATFGLIHFSKIQAKVYPLPNFFLLGLEGLVLSEDDWAIALEQTRGAVQ
jgi:type IV secretory pathway protease TraF